MKNLLLVLTVILAFINTSQATTRTASNSSAGGAQYSSLQAVYNASDHGDTILLEGTDIPYYLNNHQYFDKRVTVIGIGFNPEKQIPRKTILSTTGFGVFYFRSGASGSSFYGVQFSHRLQLDHNVNNLVFEDCSFSSDFNFNAKSSTNFAFRNCVFDNDNNANVYIGAGNQSCVGTFTNCIFDGFIDGQEGQLVSATIDHCLFLNTSSNAFLNLYDAQIKNCIFMNTFPANTIDCEFTNNLCAVAGTFPPQPENGNSGSGNIENTDPLFTSYSPGSLYNSNQDYNLQAGSPAIGAGSDMTDIGLHGGTSGFSETGEVLITPIVRSVNILNTTVAPNGTLNVEVHATAPNNN